MLSVSNPTPLKREYPLYNEVKEASKVFREMADKVDLNTIKMNESIRDSIECSENVLRDLDSLDDTISTTFNLFTVDVEKNIQTLIEENRKLKKFYTITFIILTIIIL